jgi:signal peptidase I
MLSYLSTLVGFLAILALFLVWRSGVEITNEMLVYAGAVFIAGAVILRLLFRWMKIVLPSASEVRAIAADPSAAGQPVTRGEVAYSFREFFDVVATALIMAVILRAFVVQAYKIPSGSMNDTLMEGDLLIVNRMVYGLHVPLTDKVILRYRWPQRGEIVVFTPPQDPTKDFIKRCVGLPGDVILVKEKKLFVNGVLQTEPYVVHKDPSTYLKGFPAMLDPALTVHGPVYEKGCNRDNFGPYTVPPDHIFCLGDNRDNSNDSRFWGSVPIHQVLGKPLVIWWPIDRWRWM